MIAIGSSVTSVCCQHPADRSRMRMLAGHRQHAAIRNGGLLSFPARFTVNADIIIANGQI